MPRTRLIFAGSGGQGVITAAIVLGEAAVIYAGLNAVQSQSYGAAARGGVSRSDLIVSDSEINFPKVNQPNILVCLSQDAYNRFFRMVRPGGLLITDSHFVKYQQRAEARVVSLPFYKTVVAELDLPMAQNICMLGSLQALTGLVPFEALVEVLKMRISPPYVEKNKEALRLGVRLATDL